MATQTSIEWTEVTWNPVRGCSRISPGCENCYAERMAHRFSGVGFPYEGLTRVSRSGEPRWTGRLLTISDALGEPLRWKRPRMVFVNSMSDLFHDRVPAEFVKRVFATMHAAHWHTFQVLTKRPERCLELARQLAWPSNVWMGTSIEHNEYVRRADLLRRVPAAVRFLSLEPLLSSLPDLDLGGIHWVIVGGESGPGARPMKLEWVQEIHRACRDAQVPFFFKQWGGIRKKAAGRMLDGKTWNEMPSVRPVAAE